MGPAEVSVPLATVERMNETRSTAEELPRSYTPLDGPEVMGTKINEDLPELRPVLEKLAAAAGKFVRVSYGRYRGRGAGGTLLLITQAHNDLLDTLYDIMTGRGRPALRASRSMFEHLVNARDIMGNPEMEERYVAHRAVVEHLESNLEVQANELHGRARKKDMGRRRKLRESSQAPFEEALRKYGPSFRFGWSRGNLRDRAERHSLSSEYEGFYRLASSVLHGSSGGALGLHRTIDGTSVHRTGAALALCPLAFLQTLRYFDMVIEAFESAQDRTAVSTELRKAISDARSLWPDYYRLIQKLDRSIWPKVPPAPPIAVAMIELDGTVAQWYLHDIEAGQIRKARRPSPDNIPAWQAELFDVAVNVIRPDFPHQTLFPIAVSALDAEPEPGSQWESDTWLISGRGARILDNGDIELIEPLTDSDS